MGIVYRRKVILTDASNTGWGMLCEGLRLLVGHRGSATHQLPEDDSNMSSPSDLLTRPEGTQSASPLKQHESGFLHKSPGRAHLETPLRDGETPQGMGTSQSEMTWNFCT